MKDVDRITETKLRIRDIAYLCSELVRHDPTMATVKLKSQTDTLAEFSEWLTKRVAAAQLARRQRNAERDDAA